MTRRTALKASAALGTTAWLGAAGIYARAAGANAKLNIASIGVGGQGAGITNAAGKTHTLVALCDVDEVRAGKTFAAHPTVTRFLDYRKMYDALEKQIDAVVISTPDHTHFHPCYLAFQRGKHVYLEKPLAHNISQVRTLCTMAREKKLVTQLGNQRHAIPNMARIAELIRGNAIGTVTEVHSWIGTSRGLPKDPAHPEVPKSLDWDLWVGPAKDHGYSPGFAPYEWRFWWDYGTGEAGNWGCHILDIPYRALQLKYPTKVTAKAEKADALKTPKAMSTRFEFATSQGPVVLHWHQGQPEAVKDKGFDLKNINTVFFGREGQLACGFNERRLYPVEKFKEYKDPAPSIPASPGFHKEFFEACQGGKPTTCHFEYTGPMSETVLLGNIAYRTGGKEFAWDGPTMTATGNDAVKPLLREEYRKGWELPGL